MLTSFDGGRLFGQVYGSSRPRVLALHGWRRDHRDFDLVLAGAAGRKSDEPPAAFGRSAIDGELASEPADAIALDLPGFGGTPAPETPWGSAEYAEAVASMLQEMETPVVLIGHSFGGRVAVHLGAEHPDAIGGIVLTGAPLFPAYKAQRPPLSYRAARLLARSGLLGEKRLEELKRRHGSEDYRAASGVMRDVLVRAIAEERDEAYTASLQAIRCPVELVWGELDTAAPPAVGERIAASLGEHAKLVVYPGVGHLTPLQIPGELRRAIERLS